MNDNLIPIQSEEEAREKGRKGGIASGEARRKNMKKLKKNMKKLKKNMKKLKKNMKKLKKNGIQQEHILITHMII